MNNIITIIVVILLVISSFYFIGQAVKMLEMNFEKEPHWKKIKKKEIFRREKD